MFKILLSILFLFPSVCQADITSNLSLWYKMDEGTGTSSTADSSGNSNTGNFTGTPVWNTTCPRYKCLSFDGSTTRIDSANAINPFPLSFSYAVWFVASTIGSKQVLIARNTQGSGIELQTTGKLTMYSFNGSGTAQGTSGTCPTIVAGQLYHAVGTYDGTTFKMYQNGVLCDSNAQSASSNANSSSMRLACNGQWVGVTNLFTGTLDDARVYSRALSAQDVLDLYNAPVQINNATLNNVTFNS